MRELGQLGPEKRVFAAEELVIGVAGEHFEAGEEEGVGAALGCELISPV